MTIRLKPVSVKARNGFRTRAVPYGPNTRMHWGLRARWNKAWQEEVGWALKLAGVKKPEYTRVAFRLYTTRPQDFDNSVASVKALLDGLKGIAIEDDAQKYIGQVPVDTIKVATLLEEHVEIDLS